MDLEIETLTEYYNRIALSDDATYLKTSLINRHLIQLPIIKFLRRHIISCASLADSILDVGCGNGDNLLTALSEKSIQKVIINDISEKMLELSEYKIKKSHPNISYKMLKGNLNNENIESIETSSLVMCLGVINHLKPSLIDFLKNINKLAGKYILLSFCHDKFILGEKIETNFKRRNLPYNLISVPIIINEMKRYNAKCIGIHYNYKFSYISPIVVIKFQKQYK